MNKHTFAFLPDWYEAEVLEGLETVARNELRARFGERLPLEQTHAGALRFRYEGVPQRLAELRSVTAVYAVREFAVPRPKALLGHQHLVALAGLIDAVRAIWPHGTFATLRLSAAGEDTPVMARLRDELLAQTGLAPAAEEGDMLLRLRRGRDGGWEALARLTPRPLATRAWRVCNYPGALNACVAHAMMRLTNPRREDAVLNMACGSGTLLAERLAIGPVRAAFGCDTNHDALACARANLDAAGYDDDVRLEAWDATELPLEAASIDLICADMPFGQLIGTHRINEALYPAMMAEATRVAARGARAALFTHEVRLLERTMEPLLAAWDVQDVLRVRVGGMVPRLVLLRRK